MWDMYVSIFWPTLLNKETDIAINCVSTEKLYNNLWLLHLHLDLSLLGFPTAPTFNCWENCVEGHGSSGAVRHKTGLAEHEISIKS